MTQAVSFQQILQILALTDEMDISREAVDIPLTPESPGVVRRLPNGKFEIVVDADLPFEEWLQGLEPKIQRLMSQEGQEF
jgi:hypothetical protein